MYILDDLFLYALCTLDVVESGCGLLDGEGMRADATDHYSLGVSA